MSRRITINDFRDEGYCVRGVREVARIHGIDFNKFVREGMPIDEAREIDEVVLQNIISKKEMSDDG